jgi:hypothetical protein
LSPTRRRNIFDENGNESPSAAPFAATGAPSVASLNENRDVENGIGVGLITALGVSGAAIFFLAAVVQRRRMVGKEQETPEGISIFSSDEQATFSVEEQA